MWALSVGDFGPHYYETQLGRFPVEPFNTFSNLVFLLILIVYTRKTGFRARQFPVCVLALPILAIGFIGGTVFHATRSHSVWLLMDFIPIAVLAVLAGIYFWERLLGKLWLAGAVTLFLIVGLRWILTLFSFPRPIYISLSYVTLAASIILPALLLSLRQSGKDFALVVISLASFVIAILFRIGDSDPAITAIFPMGTHFLWHLFGGLSTALLLEFVYRSEKT